MEKADLFDLTIHCDQSLETMVARCHCWPISLPASRAAAFPGTGAKNVTFAELPCDLLTPLFAFEIEATIAAAKRTSKFVMNLPMEGAPSDRRERVLSSLLRDRGQVLRYILFILAANDETLAGGSDLSKLLLGAGNNDGGTTVSTFAQPFLFEAMLRALHHDPSQLAHVASVISDLQKAPDGSVLVSEEFQQIWQPIWQACQKCNQ
jgi:hypothetical protein